MIQTIQYESDKLLPDEVSIKFEKALEQIKDCRYEDDKLICIVHRLRSDVIKWLSDNNVCMMCGNEHHSNAHNV